MLSRHTSCVGEQDKKHNCQACSRRRKSQERKEAQREEKHDSTEARWRETERVSSKRREGEEGNGCKEKKIQGEDMRQEWHSSRVMFQCSHSRVLSLCEQGLRIRSEAIQKRSMKRTPAGECRREMQERQPEGHHNERSHHVERK